MSARHIATYDWQGNQRAALRFDEHCLENAVRIDANRKIDRNDICAV